MARLTLVKVALLSDCYLPRLGGIEVQVHDLAHRLTAAGHEVEVVTATAGGTRSRTSEPEVEQRGAHAPTAVTVHRLPLPIPGAPPVNPFVKAEVRELLTSGGFDVVHGHMGVVSPFATDMIGVALEAGLPTAATWHCVIDRSTPLFRALGHARRWADAGVALSAVSSMAAERVSCIAGTDHGPRPEVRVLGNGIDVGRWTSGISRTRPDDGVVRVVSAMRLVRRKRPGALVDVLRSARDRLARQAPGVRLEAHLVGDGPQRRVIHAHLARHGIDWISLPGRLSRDELRDLHGRSDVFLSTARLEAFGIAALEARTAGLAVVALRGTGVEDFVTDGSNGILRGSDEGLVLALAELAADPARLVRMRAHNLATPPAQAWERVVEATLAEYARARHLRGGGP
jgi:glycosyltransferase involved in cell wall biosynthesis